MEDFESDPETIQLRRKIDELLQMGGSNEGLSFLAKTDNFTNYDMYQNDAE
jgi:hypothetical protein